MKTAVTTVFTGKERVFNRRFLIMADHYMIEPTACSPAAGWEKGQVEHQVPDDPRPVLPASATLREPGGAQRVAGGRVPPLGGAASPSRSA
jgi:hypothetical protein